MLIVEYLVAPPTASPSNILVAVAVAVVEEEESTFSLLPILRENMEVMAPKIPPSSCDDDNDDARGEKKLGDSRLGVAESGHAYKGQELASSFDIHSGQDLFARPLQTSQKTEREDNIHNADSENNGGGKREKEERRRRKEERARKRKEKDEHRQMKEERKRRKKKH